MCPRAFQVVGISRLATTNGTFLEVSLQNVTSGERVFTEFALVWAVTSVSEKMALQMLGVEVCLLTVGARIFAVRILLGDHRLARAGWSPTRYAW